MATPVPAAYQKIFQAAANKFGIPVNVLEGQDLVESGFNPGATSPAGAKGISQFIPGTASSYGVRFGTDPGAVSSQIMGQAHYLADLGYRGNPSLALSKYNAGPGNPGAAGDYAAKVLAAAKAYGGGSAVGTAASMAKIPMVSANFGSNGAPAGPTPPNVFDAIGGIEQARELLVDRHRGTTTINSPVEQGWQALSNLFNGQQQEQAAKANSTRVSTVAPQPQIGFNSGKGDINPLPGYDIGRTDMGVDASAHAGKPILAPNDSKVIHIYPNWYQGQPYLLLQLTAGPNKGKYYYVSEQIANLAQPGTVVRRGQPIATFAPSGTGIEIGWGTPSWQTLAQATGQIGTGDHSNAPAGVSFRNYLHGLGA